MPLWKSTNSPTLSPSSSKSSFDSPTTPSKSKRRLGELTLFRSRRGSHAGPRLTRQRKLRHLTELDVRGLDFEKQTSRSSVSANSPPSLSRSPSNRKFSSARSSTVQPLPLPLPDVSVLLRRDELALLPSPNIGCCRLPSPKDSAMPVVGEADRIVGLFCPVGNGVGERALSSSAPGRPSVGSTSDHDKKALCDSVEHIQSDFRLNVPARSAPIIGLSRPVVSPQRLSTGDIFPSPYMPYQGLQVWSAPEFPASDTIFFAKTSPEKFVTGPDCPRLHSLIGNSPGPKPKNHSGTASPLHSRMSLENSTAWHDSNGAVAFHPLPLPPGAVVPSQPAFVHQAALKSEVSSMKSQWQKGKLIGSGTFGNVYVATNRETGALCAMKEVNLIPDDPKSAECMHQLEQEIKVLSQLQHQNIVQYYGSEIVEDRFYIYLEYVHPGSISKYIRDHCGSMTESVVRNFTRHILSGLDYLHSTKTIHRDIKGANLLVDSSGVVKLADFGMAKHLSGCAAALSLKGSPYWMAPEIMQTMMQKDAGYDLAVDIWSLGCTIIEMFTGKPPWSEFEGAAAMFKVLSNESPPMPETLSAEGKNFLQCCFKRSPADRSSASKLLEHPFLKNSHHQEMHGCIQSISQMKLMDTTESTKEQSSLMKVSTQDGKGKQSSYGETGQSYPETSKSAAASRHSPCSTLEAIPSLSPPHSNHSTQNSSPSIVPKGIHPGTGSTRSCPLPRHHGERELLTDAYMVQHI